MLYELLRVAVAATLSGMYSQRKVSSCSLRYMGSVIAAMLQWKRVVAIIMLIGLVPTWTFLVQMLSL